MIEAKVADGVSFRYKNRSVLGRLLALLFHVLFFGAILQYELHSNYRNVSFDKLCEIGIFFGICVIGFIYLLILYIKNDEFKLCEECFYYCGRKYDGKLYSYTLKDDKVIFSSGEGRKIKIAIPEDKRKVILDILESHYYQKS